MTTKYGYENADWEAAKEEMRSILIERAKVGGEVKGTIPYSDVVNQVTTIHLEPDSYALAAMLGEISSEEDSAGRGMLTVIVVHKEGDMQPGPGFFDLAKRLGRDTTDVLRCWIEELKRVHRYWSSRESRTVKPPACRNGLAPVSESDLAPIDPKVIQRGTILSHPHYGQGRVDNIEGLGSTTKVTVDFALSGGPVIKFVLEHSPLRLVKDVPIGASTYRSNQGDQMTFQEVIAALQRERPGATLGETAKSGPYYDRAVRLTNFERYLGNPLRYGAMQPNGRMMWLYWTSGKICCGDKDWD